MKNKLWIILTNIVMIFTIIFTIIFVFLCGFNVDQKYDNYSTLNNNSNVLSPQINKKNANDFNVQTYQYTNGGQLLATYIDDLGDNRIVTTDNYLSIRTKEDGITLDYFILEMYIYDRVYNSNIFYTYYFVNVFDVWSNNNFDLINLINLQLDLSCTFNSDNLTCTVNADLYFIYGVESDSQLFDQTKTNTFNCDFISFTNWTCTPFKFNDFGKLLNNTFDYGSTIGYEIGKEDGEQIGYQNGYDAAKSIYQNQDKVFTYIWSIITNAIVAVFTLFSFEILPNLPLYAILAIPIIIGIIYFAIKLLHK